MSSVDSVRIAVEKAQSFQSPLLAGSAAASDAFFPFADARSSARRGRERDHPAGWVGARRAGRLSGRRCWRGDGRNRPPPFPALSAVPDGAAPEGDRLRSGRGLVHVPCTRPRGERAFDRAPVWSRRAGLDRAGPTTPSRRSGASTCRCRRRAAHDESSRRRARRGMSRSPLDMARRCGRGRDRRSRARPFVATLFKKSTSMRSRPANASLCACLVQPSDARSSKPLRLRRPQRPVALRQPSLCQQVVVVHQRQDHRNEDRNRHHHVTHRSWLAARCGTPASWRPQTTPTQRRR